MNALKLIFALGMGALVSACGGTAPATRNAPFEPIAPPKASAPALQPVTITQINVEVPRGLTVSEANTYLPNADIVWRGDLIGDRHAQVAAIFTEAFSRTAASISGDRNVVVDARVVRFHGLTEKARYSVGGVHNIEFDLMVRDAETGVLLAEPKRVRADLDAFGGREAIRADARGETQKVRITAHLAEVLRQEIMVPGGHKTANLGLFQQMNKPTSGPS
ncbi:MAG: DUF6778 family protein [Pseudomonadota bacterium]